ncbi:unnamed protein product [Amoebophrya sp. A120]|nr:unnamed protein product [Amoebophrya sp. A120]|eukprot:GSA120T00007630001.1
MTSTTAYYTSGQQPQPQVHVHVGQQQQPVYAQQQPQVIIAQPQRVQHRPAPPASSGGSTACVKTGIQLTQGLFAFLLSLYMFLLIWGVRMDKEYIQGWWRDTIYRDAFGFSFIDFMQFAFHSPEKNAGGTAIIGDTEWPLFTMSIVHLALMGVLVITLNIARCTPIFNNMKKTTGLLVFLCILSAVMLVIMVLSTLRIARISKLFSQQNEVWENALANWPMEGDIRSLPVTDPKIVRIRNAVTPPLPENFRDFRAQHGVIWLLDVWSPICAIACVATLLGGYAQLPSAAQRLP